jgi:hypothetical protein
MLRPSAFILHRERVAVNRLSSRRANVLAVRTPRSFASGATQTVETRPFPRVSDQPRGEFRVLEAVQESHHGLLALALPPKDPLPEALRRSRSRATGSRVAEHTTRVHRLRFDIELDLDRRFVRHSVDT